LSFKEFLLGRLFGIFYTYSESKEKSLSAHIIFVADLVKKFFTPENFSMWSLKIFVPFEKSANEKEILKTINFFNWIKK
jgi:hypothetical protein